MAYRLPLTVTIVLALWSATAKAQFTANDCVDLQFPGIGNIQPANSAPFFIASTTDSYTPGRTQPYLVFIASGTPLVARSVILQARRSDNNAPVGSFTTPASNLYQLLSCPGSATGTIVSTDTTPKPLNLQFMWTAPPVGVGDIIFTASLVLDNNAAYVGVTAGTALTGPQASQLTIDNCPNPTVAANGALSYQPPACRISNNFVGIATCNPSAGTTLPPGVTDVTCTCTNGAETVSCTFTATYTPSATACNPDPCLNGGSCFEVPTLPRGFFCSCVGGFTGDVCENGGTGPGPLVVNPCPPSLNNFGNTFIWTAPSCTRDGNVIGQATCNPPSGTSFMGPVNSVTCTCMAGDEQATCPFNINAGPAGPACQPNPCSGGNECREATSTQAGYTCHSMTGTPCP